MSSSLKILNQNSEASRRDQSLMMNIHAARSLESILKSNLGPKGTLKMLVSGSGGIKLTKDGRVLLNEMHIQHPTANLIARAATSQDDSVGDGTTSTVLLCGEIMKLSERYLNEGIHPRLLVEGIELARTHLFNILPTLTKPITSTSDELVNVVNSVLQTKLARELVEIVSPMIVDAVQTVQTPSGIDLLCTNTELIKGIVLDHGARHPLMPKDVRNCYILTCNVSMEYEKSEVNSSVFYSDAEQRTALVKSERAYADAQVAKIVALAKTLDGPLVVINQKGIDQRSLDGLAAAGVMALRRAKRRNMERITKVCGGVALNSFEDSIDKKNLGRAGHVFEVVVSEEKYTFIEDCLNPTSCTILMKGSDDQEIQQVKDAVRDGLRAAKNAIESKCVLYGAGSFELSCWKALEDYMKTVKGKAKLGVKVLAEALLIIPKTLIENSGFDVVERLYELQDNVMEGKIGGVDVETGAFKENLNVWDGYMVKKQMIQLSTVLASQLMLIDVVMRCGKSNRSKGADAGQFN
ncbi:Chaperonin-containing TCP-1 [Entamoeba marina]